MLKLKDLYDITSVSNSAELLYITELGKYCHWMYNTELSLQGVSIGIEYQDSPYWGYFSEMVRNGWLTDTDLSLFDLLTDEATLKYQCDRLDNVYICEDDRQFNKIDMAERTRNKKDIHYQLQVPVPKKVNLIYRDRIALFETASRGINLTYISGANTDQLWVSLFAYLTLKKYYMKSFDKALILLNFSLVKATSLDYALILMNKTDALKGTIYFTCDSHIIYPNDVDEKLERELDFDKAEALKYIKKESGYSAWYRLGSDMGLCDSYMSQNGKAYRTPSEKFDYMRELGLCVGDFVVCYTRSGKSLTDYKRSISEARIAYIADITKDGVLLIYFNTCDLYETSSFMWKYCYTSTVKAMYSVPPFEKLNTTKEFVEFYDLGVKYYLAQEPNLIVPLLDSEDAVEQILPRYKGSLDYVKVFISQNDLIYWICKEYGFDFDDIDFKRKYIEGNALYDLYQKGADLCGYGGSLITKNGVIQYEQLAQR